MDHMDSAPAAPAGRFLGGLDTFPRACAAPDTGPKLQKSPLQSAPGAARGSPIPSEDSRSSAGSLGCWRSGTLPGRPGGGRFGCSWKELTCQLADALQDTADLYLLRS